MLGIKQPIGLLPLLASPPQAPLPSSQFPTSTVCAADPCFCHWFHLQDTTFVARAYVDLCDEEQESGQGIRSLQHGKKEANGRERAMYNVVISGVFIFAGISF
jgi:hypothetical protein